MSTSYDALLELFECLGNFLKRLHIYTEISLDPLMADTIAKIMVELISILAVAKKQIGRGRLSKQHLAIILGGCSSFGTQRRAIRKEVVGR